MTILIATLTTAWLLTAALAGYAYHQAERARFAAVADRVRAHAELARVLRAVSEGRLTVEREAGGYVLTEVVSRPGAAIHAEDRWHWPPQRLDCGNLFVGLRVDPRPALLWWQRLLVSLAPDGWLKAQPWVRAHVGGRWARRTSTGRWHRVPFCPSECHGLLRMMVGVEREEVEAHAARCTCEVYPYDAPSGSVA